MLLILLLVLLVVFEVAAVRWGVDSADAWDSPEWERRRHWHGYAGSR